MRVPGRGSFIGRALRLPLDLLPSVPMWILSGPLRGKRWIVNSSNHGYLIGSHEREKQDHFASTIEKGSLVFDLGAHVGVFSLLACSRGARVVAVEPNTTNASFIRRHLALNGYEGAVVEAAVSLTDGSAPFAPGPNPSTGRLATEGPAVNTVALDSLSDRFGYPDIVKMDIEGAEAEAMLGGARTLERVRVIFVACHYGQRARCVEILRSKGFQIQSPWEDPDELVAHC